MNSYGNQAGEGRSSRMYQAQSLLKNSIMRANVRSGKMVSAKQGKSLSGRLFGAAFSGMIYILSLIVIGALVFIYLF